MSDTERPGAAELWALCTVLTSDSSLARPLWMLELTKKLARMLGGWGLAPIETRLSSTLMPPGDLSAHCSREISWAQVTPKGDSHDATPPLSR